ncbi:hypothetical protein [Leptolyngbya iicbica]|uniref:SPOR domain-containing protein n=3 Tax=Cyanophyceae TaxID=3028117 RepID=A0A4Q7EHW3_9CYAN|nr:hypothetical protein DYY88_06865 [Leptolyngbya sp. LK]
MKHLRWWSLALLIAAGSVTAPRAGADEFPPCAPPNANEYLLLVQGDTVEARDRIQNLLPTTTIVSVCRYLDDVVVRAGGFTSLENANAWAQYLTEAEGAQAFVARPAAPGEVTTSTPIAAEPVAPAVTPEPAPAQPTTPEPTPAVTDPVAAAEVAYAPKLLGEGYAVLVNYSNNPDIAKQLQQSLNQPVGLAIYQQRPFLLATQSTDPQAAAQVLQTLSNSRFGAFIVDSSEVVLLSEAVATP